MIRELERERKESIETLDGEIEKVQGDKRGVATLVEEKDEGSKTPKFSTVESQKKQPKIPFRKKWVWSSRMRHQKRTKGVEA